MSVLEYNECVDTNPVVGLQRDVIEKGIGYICDVRVSIQLDRNFIDDENIVYEQLHKLQQFIYGEIDIIQFRLHNSYGLLQIDYVRDNGLFWYINGNNKLSCDFRINQDIIYKMLNYIVNWKKDEIENK